MRYSKLLLLSFTLLIFSACKKEIIPDLTECWEEVEPDGVIQFAGTSHTFCFLNDTDFTIKITRWTDVIPGPDCETITEYIEGTYQWDGDLLAMQGIYTDSDFSTPGVSCDGKTNFQRNFKIEVISETKILLDRNNESLTSSIRLVKQ